MARANVLFQTASDNDSGRTLRIDQSDHQGIDVCQCLAEANASECQRTFADHARSTRGHPRTEPMVVQCHELRRSADLLDAAHI